MHPNKHIREALEYAEEHGWRIVISKGHAYRRIYCGCGHRDCKKSVWSTPRNSENHARDIRRQSRCLSGNTSMNPEFYLILAANYLTQELEDAVFEAGSDDASLTMRGGKAAICVCHRQGELSAVVRTALQEARDGGLDVDHVEIDNEVFVHVSS